MVALIIIGVLVAIITAIMLIPVGVDVGYEKEQFHLSAKLDGFLLQLIPKPPRDESKKKEPKKKKPRKEKKKKDSKPEEEKPKKKRELNFSKEEILDLVKAVLKGLGKFGRKLKVSRFVLHFLAAGDDPYDTAMTYGYVNGALSSLAPLCAERFTVKDCDVWTDVDFTAEKMYLDLGVAITIRIGQIVGVGLTIGFGALKILIKNKIRLKKEKRQLKKAGLAESGAPADEEKENIQKENIQEEERMTSNG